MHNLLSETLGIRCTDILQFRVFDFLKSSMVYIPLTTATLTGCYGLNAGIPQNSYVEGITPTVAVSGHGASKEVIQVNY